MKARTWPRLNALGKLFRTTASKLTLVYLTVFALFAAFLLGYFAWNTRRLVTEQITETVDAEVRRLADQHRDGGLGRRPAANRYLLPTLAGEGLAGNVGWLAAGVIENPGWTETAYRRIEDVEGN